MEKYTEILQKNIGVSWKECDMSACVHGNGEKDKQRPAAIAKSVY